MTPETAALRRDNLARLLEHNWRGRGQGPRPGGRGKRRFRLCEARGCNRSYFGPAPHCPQCRITFRDAIQIAGMVLVCAAIVLCP